MRKKHRINLRVDDDFLKDLLSIQLKYSVTDSEIIRLAVSYYAKIVRTRK